MTKEQWVNSISKDEIAFRMFKRGHFEQSCFDCVFFKSDEYHHWKCASEEHLSECERQYQEWLDEEME